jgi:hypothetical protein
VAWEYSQNDDASKPNFTALIFPISLLYASPKIHRREKRGNC